LIPVKTREIWASVDVVQNRKARKTKKKQMGKEKSIGFPDWEEGKPFFVYGPATTGGDSQSRQKPRNWKLQPCEILETKKKRSKRALIPTK